MLSVNDQDNDALRSHNTPHVLRYRKAMGLTTWDRFLARKIHGRTYLVHCNLDVIVESG